MEILRAEVERLTEINAALMDKETDLRSLRIDNGEAVMEVGGRLISLISYPLARMLDLDGESLANYIEIAMHDEKIGAMVLTLQRKSGKTPHELRREAESENVQLRQELQELRGLNGECGRCRQLEDELARAMGESK